MYKTHHVLRHLTHTPAVAITNKVSFTVRAQQLVTSLLLVPIIVIDMTLEPVVKGMVKL